MPDLPTERSAMFGTCTPPWKISGSWSVKEMAWLPCLAFKLCASRFKKPERKSRRPPSSCPSSMLSCVSKWLRVRSVVPANGMNAASPLLNMG
ncbi:hypothetical protein D3C72_1844640 [compost metagenome]